MTQELSKIVNNSLDKCLKTVFLLQTAGSDNSAKHSGNEESARNTQWSWKHLQLNAGEDEEEDDDDDDDDSEMQGWDDCSLQSVLDEATTAWGIKVERVEMWARISISIIFITIIITRPKPAYGRQGLASTFLVFSLQACGAQLQDNPTWDH